MIHPVRTFGRLVEVGAVVLREFTQVLSDGVGEILDIEQDGTGPSYERPVLIIRGFSPHVCVVVPLATSKKRDRFYISAGMVEDKNAAAIVSQIRLIDTRRLINKVGTLDRATFNPIRKAARKLL